MISLVTCSCRRPLISMDQSSTSSLCHRSILICCMTARPQSGSPFGFLFRASRSWQHWRAARHSKGSLRKSVFSFPIPVWSRMLTIAQNQVEHPRMCTSNAQQSSHHHSLPFLADNHHVPLVEIVDPQAISSGEFPLSTAAGLWQRSDQGVFMVDRNNTGKLLPFPVPTPVPESSARDWSCRVLETRDNLVSALEFLRGAYNENLAGKPVKSFDQILVEIGAILGHDEKVTPYTVVGSIRIHGSTSTEVKRRVLLLFPASSNNVLEAGNGTFLTREEEPGNAKSPAIPQSGFDHRGRA
jgi:hypothetical protein